MTDNPLSTGQDHRQQRNELVTSIKARADEKKSLSEHLADRATSFFGSIVFLVLNLIVFIVWLVLNSNLVPGLAAFDPFPFVALTTIVSLEAIILAVFVLISQNRASRVADLRKEINLQLTIIDKEETTKILSILAILLDKSGIDVSADKELQAMTEHTDTEKLEKAIEKQLGN